MCVRLCFVSVIEMILGHAYSDTLSAAKNITTSNASLEVYSFDKRHENTLYFWNVHLMIILFSLLSARCKFSIQTVQSQL